MRKNNASAPKSKPLAPIGEIRNFMGQVVIHGPVLFTIPDGTKVFIRPSKPKDQK